MKTTIAIFETTEKKMLYVKRNRISAMREGAKRESDKPGTTLILLDNRFIVEVLGDLKDLVKVFI